MTEETAPQPQTPYSEAKLEAERRLSRGPGSVVTLRLSTVYGPGEDGPRAVPSFINAFLRSETPILHGDGSDVRDYVHVEDVAAAIVNACLRSLASPRRSTSEPGWGAAPRRCCGRSPRRWRSSPSSRGRRAAGRACGSSSTRLSRSASSTSIRAGSSGRRFARRQPGCETGAPHGWRHEGRDAPGEQPLPAGRAGSKRGGVALLGGARGHRDRPALPRAGRHRADRRGDCPPLLAAGLLRRVGRLPGRVRGGTCAALRPGPARAAPRRRRDPPPQPPGHALPGRAPGQGAGAEGRLRPSRPLPRAVRAEVRRHRG